MNSEQLFDLRSTLDNLDNDVEILRLVSATFVADAPRLLAELRSALTDRNLSMVVRAGHSLKGSAQNFGAAELIRAVGALEEASRTHDFESAAGLLGEVERLLARLSAELRAL
ncbi:Hpt domain-containing protein [Aromatoleum petrolei]|uniref:Hpt domain-containing protein n=1 Tax=Aromatoleum petrolei TaxID=76116 RepID=A0ABX1MW76_9RHOO|nr:Hpt domain-containing protein [Aromatoleum petrolei]NMF90344.1 Hpt domain-containing protein [Aromatoleum petrolei]QTQ37961.1 HPt (histidine-containing phosphotransfer) domain-containing protein [Aromatoleum petrolei]